MTIDPIKFSLKLSELPEGYRGLEEERIIEIIWAFFTKHFEELGGETSVSIGDDYVIIQWLPNSLSDKKNAIEKAINLLNEGEVYQGEIMLSALYDHYPDNHAILFNYGMLLSDKGKFDEAIRLLNKLNQLDPDNHRALNALAVAYMRAGMRNEALLELKKSYEIEPEDPYTLKNLGAVLANESEEEALPYLEKAANLLPDDPQTQYGYGLCLKKMGDRGKADLILQKVIELAPYTELCELAKEARSEIASDNFRGKTGSEPRMDVVMYCLAALEKFNSLGHEKAKTVTFEIAMLGRNGLDIQSTDNKYTLNSLEGKFTGLQLASYMFVGLKQIDPNIDPGIDFVKEYQVAQDLFKTKTS